MIIAPTQGLEIEPPLSFGFIKGGGVSGHQAKHRKVPITTALYWL